MASSVEMHLEGIIKKLLAPDNELIKQGTAEVRAALNKPETILQLCELMVSHKEEPVRQYAAIILRKRLSKRKYWQQVPMETQALIKKGMLNTLIHEQRQPVRTALAQLVGRLIAHEDGQCGLWANEVFQFIFTYCHSANAMESEHGSSVFATLADVAGDQFTQHVDKFCMMFTEALRSMEFSGAHASKTIFNIIKGMGYLVPFIFEEKIAKATYQNSVPLVVKCLMSYVTDEPDRFCSAFELLENIEEKIPSLLAENVGLLMDFCLKTSSNSSLEKIVRVKTVAFASSLIRFHKKTVVTQQMIEPIIAVVFNLMSIKTEDEEDYDDGDFGGSHGSNIIKAAAQTLDTLVASISPDKFLAPLLGNLEAALQKKDPLAHRAAYLSMAIMVEGCSETIRDNYLETMVNTVTAGLAAEISLVRDAAFFTLIHFAEYLQPDISRFAPKILPLLLDSLSQLCKGLRCGGTEPRYIHRMFYALGAFCENLGPDLVPHLPILMESVFEATTLTSSAHVRELALGTIAAAAKAAKDHLLPYFGHLITLLQTYLIDTQHPDIVRLRARAIYTLAAVARNVGQENFLPLAEDSMNYALTLLNGTHDPDVHGSVYNLLGALATVVHEEMAAIYPQVLEHIYSSVVFTEYSPMKEENSEGESDDSDDTADAHDVTVGNAYLKEKEQAIRVLQDFAENTGSAFLPYAQNAFEYVFKVLDNKNDFIRTVAIEALTKFVLTRFNHDEKSTTKTMNTLISRLYSVVHYDKEISVVVVTLQSIAELLRELGEVALTSPGVIRQIYHCICDILNSKTACQFHDNYTNSDNDMSEMDGYIIEAAGEILPLLGYALGRAQFDTYFKDIYGLFLEKCQKFKMHDHLKSQRASIYGTLGECFAGLSGFSAKYFDQLLPIFADAFNDPFYKVRRNAIYSLSELVANAGPKSYNSYPFIMSAFSSLISVEQHPGCLDNICGALACIISNNYSLVPLDEVMPVFIQLLPLREDFDDYKAVFSCLKLVYTKKPHLLLNCFEKIISVLFEVNFKQQFTDQATEEDALCVLKIIREYYPTQFNIFKQSNPDVLAFLDAIENGQQ